MPFPFFPGSCNHSSSDVIPSPPTQRCRRIWQASVLLGLFLITVFFLPMRAESRRFLAPSIRALLGNGIGELASDGLSLWMGTDAGLSRIALDAVDSGDWTTFTPTDGLAGSNITALAVGNGEVWIAAGHDSAAGQTEVSDGISVTRNGGQTWETFRPERAFGLANTVWDLAVTTGAVWAATWNAFGNFDTGLIRSTNGGQTWQAINPNTNPQGEFTFAVVADGPRVWVGTAAGLSRSNDNGLNWSVTTTANGLTGNWVFAIQPQVIGTDTTLWAANWPAGTGEQYGVAASHDGGVSWTAVDTLRDVQAVDFSFSDSTVWAATLDGLWMSPNAGQSWQRFDTDDGLADVEAVSVHTLGDTVWVGSGQNGLSVSFNRGASWAVTRASVPTVTLGDPARADTIQTYAFPNPFSPVHHGVTRIRYSLSGTDDVSVEVFDLANSPVKTLLSHSPRAAGEQFVPWDGRNGRNMRVANGVYFYRIFTRSGRHAEGKIIVLD